jgi:hypothetical protein
MYKLSSSLVVQKRWLQQQVSPSAVLLPFKLFLRHICALFFYFHLFYTALFNFHILPVAHHLVSLLTCEGGHRDFSQHEEHAV